MPFLMLIDSENEMPTSGPFAVGPEIQTHTVSDREGARRILAYDLQQTADATWAAPILAKFDQGENEIEVPNGIGHTFRVEYREDRK
jgi:hypothetical protein